MPKFHVPILVDWNDIKDHMAKLDIVEVVRCKDCKYRHPSFCEVWSKYGTVQTTNDDFCSYGERRTDEIN